MSKQECHMNLQFYTWSHMFAEKSNKFFSTAASLNCYPLDCMMKLLLLTARTLFNNVGNFVAGRCPPPRSWNSCTSFYTRSTLTSVFETPIDISDSQSPRDGSSAIFESVGTLDIQALKDASNSTFKYKSRIGLALSLEVFQDIKQSRTASLSV